MGREMTNSFRLVHLYEGVLLRFVMTTHSYLDMFKLQPPTQPYHSHLLPSVRYGSYGSYGSKSSVFSQAKVTCG